jgi:diphthamide biosynthesis protein 4
MLLLGQITDEVPLTEMSFENEIFSHPCRCSGLYQISFQDLENGHEIVQCSKCSLKVRILQE